MIWAKVSSWSCFCWLNRASSSLAAKNIMKLISVLTILWCSCVASSLVLLEDGVSMTSTFSWQISVSLCPASFCTPRTNLSVTPGISWLSIFAFQPPIMKKSFLRVLVLEGFVGLYRTIHLRLLQHYWSGHRFGFLWYWMFCLGNKQRSFCHFWGCTQALHFGLFCWLWGLLHFFYGILAHSTRYDVIWIKFTHSHPF